MWLQSRFHWLEAAFWKNNFSEPEKLFFSGHPQLHFDVLRKHFGPDSSPVFLEQHLVVSYGPDEPAALIKACVKSFAPKSVAWQKPPASTEKVVLFAKEFEKFEVMLATSEQTTSASRQSRNMRVSCPVV